MDRDAAVAAGATDDHRVATKLAVDVVLASLTNETRVAKLRLCFHAMDSDESG